ncbi:hypothetical protein B0H13DRAFT_1882007 [Mycena leptocephala]|nr:hypothetical protein B0H13DRAFT_1882007 [Mycena leptocephala]
MTGFPNWDVMRGCVRDYGAVEWAAGTEGLRFAANDGRSASDVWFGHSGDGYLKVIWHGGDPRGPPYARRGAHCVASQGGGGVGQIPNAVAQTRDPEIAGVTVVMSNTKSNFDGFETLTNTFTQTGRVRPTTWAQEGDKKSVRYTQNTMGFSPEQSDSMDSDIHCANGGSTDLVLRITTVTPAISGSRVCATALGQPRLVRGETSDVVVIQSKQTIFARTCTATVAVGCMTQTCFGLTRLTLQGGFGLGLDYRAYVFGLSTGVWIPLLLFCGGLLGANGIEGIRYRGYQGVL